MPGPRFLELVRVSSAGQAARDTPQDQRAALDALRLSRPGTFVERIDSAVSGAKDSDDRADLSRLFALAAEHAFDELRVRHVDRLTRHPDPRQRAAIFGALTDCGAKVVEASGRVIDPADEMGELDLTLQGWIAARERKRILERTLAARKRLAGEGKIQGRPPYARTWDKKAGKWGEDPERIEVYRRIFREVLAGRSLVETAAALNDDEIQTPLGREWTASHVGRLVRHRSAVGIVEGWGRLFRCPAVVTEEEWKRAQEMLKRSGQRRGPVGHHPALLRRVLVCGACGSKMWVQRGGRPGDVRSFYVCSTHRRTTDPDCRRWHPVPIVDALVQDAIREEARQPQRIKAAHARKKQGDPAAEARQAVARATRELHDVDKREERLARLATKGLLSERVASQQLAEVARLRNTAQVEFNAATGRLEALERIGKDRTDLAAKMAKLAREIEGFDFDDWRAFIRAEFPPGCSIRLDPDGEITLAGLISFAPSTVQVRSL